MLHTDIFYIVLNDKQNT